MSDKTDHRRVVPGGRRAARTGTTRADNGRVRVRPDTYELLHQLAATCGRSVQSVADDVLGVGVGLVLLHHHDPERARELLNEISSAVAASTLAATGVELEPPVLT